MLIAVLHDIPQINDKGARNATVDPLTPRPKYFHYVAEFAFEYVRANATAVRFHVPHSDLARRAQRRLRHEFENAVKRIQVGHGLSPIFRYVPFRPIECNAAAS